MSQLLRLHSDLGPLTEDVEELLARFQQTDSVRYEVFLAIWREMRFSDLFLGIPRMSELTRFCRVALAAAVKYFLPPYSYQIRVGGLYLMYGFYHTQLAVPPLNIRLSLGDWEHVQHLLGESVHCGHYDTAYILKRLVATKAIHYTAMPHHLTFRQCRQTTTERVCAKFLSPTVRVQELLSTELLEEAANVESLYENLKKNVMAKNGLVTVTRPGFSDRLKDCAIDFVTWQQNNLAARRDASPDQQGEPAGTECGGRARLLSAIKDKCYASYQEVSKSRRHRKVETAVEIKVEAPGSGTEQIQEIVGGRRKRPVSLRARTRNALRVPDKLEPSKIWVVSTPEGD
ncbi:snRNA-activating protein complex subunit 1-like [Lampris incognitus]|uniref:snRNA-activating protein complex subunit 1-like n=1 Tax=Lampris incognitus TaxID=2546036 RepID=UPI0024B5D335|nr:snRNA-activating protein complex subunit 1-like [Lampris incognitus]